MVEYKMNYGPAIGEHSAKKKISPDGKKIVKKSEVENFSKLYFLGGKFQDKHFLGKIAN